MKKLLSIFLMATLVVFGSFANDDEKTPATAVKADKDIVDLAAGTDFLSTLVAAVKAGGLVDVLKGDGPFTVFAPTNEAFAKLPAGTVESLLKPENKDQLVKILTYHVIPGSIKSSDLKDGMEVETVQGQKVTVKLAGGKAMINKATVTAADIEATNGMVHVIDTVILPEM
ncbi:Uncaracterized surface protein containing fasciclin (FAS1) repeats [Cyclobacterium xiamenense]|uniref:Uncaracterized surface protein containing fasciclin (FAS1) repeats n=1 Tax=Cyclobacterium xiamenense TaxID=1297121 RepID=A0A1H7BCM9_9BACT|nr:fasciclin domain-containing protein [Cyclobacterium xiamenense]SEJ75208.1 Uncaracterized surface protein containing fasciclin (FAS1) repeats [Cyclobacterium xiamenense]